ncbi:HesA/MoeB/ThiF family protein [Flavobacterium kingsejongi]|uniref:Molybdopterin-synthase adenylyltransferase n=1 Tax=Flavobacterium kingsejongi TaxID=1678728 RepID=A0A2S1LJY9_9FLAO|nr:HesA/MoeB/ThiF family protein [Flavobacterium kingsejongi]AWG24072.1 thiamine biosynthesis protein ThiF [Flavobacterium kingsejongi]
MVSLTDFLRYNRQIMLPEIGESGQEKINTARVLVIGAGGLGCPVLQYLAAAGVGTLGIIDFDQVELHNLHRQILYTDEHIGMPKATTAGMILEKLNPNLKYIVHTEKLQLSNAEMILSNFNFIIDGSDNFDTRYLVNDTCTRLKKPLIYGSILNYEGQMAVFVHNGGKNLRHLFPEPPNAADVPNCNLNGVMGTLPGIIGSMMAHETLKIITGLPTLHNELILLNTLYWSWTKLSF